MDIGNFRKEYALNGLRRKDLNPNPFEQFELWFQQACDANLAEPNAMSLATASVQAQPSQRMVLLKYFDRKGFVFFTNYESKKAQQITENSQVSLLFFWVALERQVQILGNAVKISTVESIKYFTTRPRGSQIGAWCSQQSSVSTWAKLIGHLSLRVERSETKQSQHSGIASLSLVMTQLILRTHLISSRTMLEIKFDEIKRKFQNQEITLPSAWGGYRVVPHSFEFWQGRQNRLHDRFLYSLLNDGSWEIQRLAP